MTLSSDAKDDGVVVFEDGIPAAYNRWMGQAGENIEEWGIQDEETLLLAMQEELGELTQAVLEARSEGGDSERIGDELDDLGALLIQFHEAREVSDAE